MSTVIDFSGCSFRGTRHGKINQDAFFCEKLVTPTGPCWIAGVFDGHGLLGEKAAETAVETLKSYVHSSSFDPSEFVKDAITKMEELFELLHAAIIKCHHEIPTHYSYTDNDQTLKMTLSKSKGSDKVSVYKSGGTSGKRELIIPVDFGCTAVVALVYDGTAIIANTGDAAAVFCECELPTSDEHPEGLGSQVLTAVHKPSNENEIDRLTAKFSGIIDITDDGYITPKQGHLKGCLLNITRSLGHIHFSHLGLSHTPETITHKLDAKHSYALILCSDGVLDWLRPKDVLHIVAESETAEKTAQEICDRAQNGAMDISDIDDCTAVVFCFQ